MVAHTWVDSRIAIVMELSGHEADIPARRNKRLLLALGRYDQQARTVRLNPVVVEVDHRCPAPGTMPSHEGPTTCLGFGLRSPQR